jgi:hypothetical protein
MNGCGQVQIQLVRVGGHFADEFFMGKDAVTLQLTVVINAIISNANLENYLKSRQKSAEQDY